MVRRGTAVAGDRLLVSGTIGDGYLGLAAARGTLKGSSAADVAWLADRYHLPSPRLGLGASLQDRASAAADVSDGLVADAGRIGIASNTGVELDLDRTPLSPAALAWLERQPDRSAALTELATGGDDYEIICTAAADAVAPLRAAAVARGFSFTEIGRVVEGTGVTPRIDGSTVSIDRPGYRHA